MSFIPALQIGVWNVWTFMIAWVFFHMIPLTWPLFRYNLKAIFKKSGASVPYNKTEKIVGNLGTAVWIILFIYSIFLPLPLGSPLLYAGIALFIVGVIIVEIAEIPWVSTPIDKPVTRGIYRYSRHPIYIGVFIQYIGIGIASASGLFLLLVVIQIALSAYTVAAEERFCCETYGEPYRHYLNKTQRWIGIPKG